MILFIVPIPSRRTIKRWSVVEQNLLRTTRSLECQASGEYKAIIVGHERPSCNFSRQLEFLNVPYEPLGPEATPSERIADANCKVHYGWKQTSKENLRFVMRLDADDLLHRDFVTEIDSIETVDAVIFESGYIWKPGKFWLQHRRAGFWRHCGSSILVSTGLFDALSVSKGILCKDPRVLALEPMLSFPYEHKAVKHFLDLSAGTIVRSVYTPFVTYVIGHGENNEDRFRFLRSNRLSVSAYRAALGFSVLNVKYVQIVTKEFREDFSIS